MVTINQVKKAIREIGGEEQLFKEDGYFYFGECSADSWFTSSVYVLWLNDLSLESWIA
jgi:hypothetical protein